MKYLTLLLSALLWAASLGAQCAQIINSPTSENLLALYFSSAAEGLVLAENGQVWATSNGGGSWQLSDLRTSVLMNAIQSRSGGTAWAAGPRGILRTRQGGSQSWQQQFSPLGSDWQALDFRNATHGLLAGSCGALLRTTNGGEVWEWANSGTPETLRALRWLDDTRALAAGDAGVLLRTTDGGQNWSAAGPGTAGQWLALASRAAEAWVSGPQGTYRSADYGQSWSAVSSQAFQSMAAFGNGAAVGVGLDGVVRFTQNGGQSWPALEVPLPGPFSQLQADDNGQVYLCGAGGQLLRLTLFAVQAQGPSQACAGSPVSLLGNTLNVPATYRWRGPGGFASSSSAPTTTAAQTGWYVYTIERNGCSRSDSLFLQVLPKPEINLGPNLQLCEGEQAVLQTTADGAYLWNTGAVTPSITVSTAGTYSLTVTNDADCTAQDAVEVTMLEQSTLLLSDTLCSDASLVVNGTTYAANNPQGTEVIAGGSANGCDSVVMVDLSFVFPEPITFDTSICENDFPYDYFGVSLPEAGNYQLELETPEGCPQPHLLSIGARPSFEEEFSASICEGEFLLWGSDTLRQAGTYEQLLTAQNGCDSLRRLVLSVFPAPEINLLDTLPDDGSGNGAAAVEGVGGSPPYAFSWSNGATGASVSGLAAGTYEVTVTDANGCAGVLQVEVPLLNSLRDADEQNPYLSLFPNPNTGTFQLRVSASALPAQALLYDGSGQLVDSRPLSQPLTEWASQLPAGSYLLRLKRRGEWVAACWVVVR